MGACVCLPASNCRGGQLQERAQWLTQQSEKQLAASGLLAAKQPQAASAVVDSRKEVLEALRLDCCAPAAASQAQTSRASASQAPPTFLRARLLQHQVIWVGGFRL